MVVVVAGGEPAADAVSVTLVFATVAEQPRGGSRAQNLVHHLNGDVVGTHAVDGVVSDIQGRLHRVGPVDEIDLLLRNDTLNSELRWFGRRTLPVGEDLLELGSDLACIDIPHHGHAAAFGPKILIEMRDELFAIDFLYRIRGRQD